MKKLFGRWLGIALAFAILPGIVTPVAAEDPVNAKTAPGTVFRESLRSGGMGPEMVVLPSGSFRMGCLSDDEDCSGSEKPVHEVRIPRPFAVSVYEVKFEDYGHFRPHRADLRNPRDRERHPVIYVSWEDARAYVAWLSRETGAEYRLLSESEWEYAARAGSATKYSWGDEIGSSWPGKRTHSVGLFRPNGFGLYDMHGNVWEWVEDCWNGSYEGAPSDGSAWLQGRCNYRVLRGGGPWYDTRPVRSALRFRSTADGGDFDVGFRVARTLTP